MTTTTEPSLFIAELARIDEMVRRIDTQALNYRLIRNLSDQTSFLAHHPATRDWLRYEHDAITEELTRRTGG